MSEPGGTSVAFERKGYARGLILGLTMAETMLLLVFCLLLAAGAIINKTKKETAAAQKIALSLDERRRKLEDENKRLLAQLNVMAKAVTGRNIPDQEWRELVLAKEVVDTLKKTRLTLEEVVKNAEATKILSEHDVDADQAEIMVEHIKVLRQMGFVGDGKTSKDLEDALKKAAGSELSAKPHDWPPIISLSEFDGYNFDTGSAELSDPFKTKLRAMAKIIAGIATSYGVDVIEVIGHTDEQAMAGEMSNMDKGLRPVLTGKMGVGSLHPADNAGLGLARAISVTSILREMPELQGFTILPMSGGQLILPGDHLTDGAQAGDVKARRRIEIRVRQRSRETDLVPAQGQKS